MGGADSRKSRISGAEAAATTAAAAGGGRRGGGGWPPPPKIVPSENPVICLLPCGESVKVYRGTQGRAARCAAHHLLPNWLSEQTQVAVEREDGTAYLCSVIGR